MPSDEQLEAWLGSVAEERNDNEVKQLRAAIELASEVHARETMNDGVPRILALLHTVDILDRLKLDTDTLIAAVLSELPGTPDYDSAVLANQFGAPVVAMLEQVSNIRELSASSNRVVDAEKDIENVRRMLLGLAQDVRSILVILAKRLRLMRFLKALPIEVQRRVASETHRVHAPLANRLGVWQIKWELEDLCLRHLHAHEYKSLAKQLDGKRREREAFIKDVIDRLLEASKASGIHAEITGRPKHIYSIWKKMQRKRVDFDQVFDVRAVRVLVDTVPQCYEVLGLVHSMWRPIPGEFDDYIAHPKPNGYKSLHTAVVGDDGRPLEVQVRTQDMHEHAERGVAAHWRYKENTGQDSELERRIEWMRRWLEQQETASTDDLKDEDPLSDQDREYDARRIYVLTPQGKVVELPAGATPIDFAYSIHTSVGHRCRGAKANGRIIQLAQPLRSGQTVEILTTKEEAPSRDWLNPHSGYISTNKARNRIKSWFRHQDYDENIHRGKAILDREVARLGIDKPNLEKMAIRFHYDKPDDLLAAIGQGDVSAIQVANAQIEQVRLDAAHIADRQIPEKLKHKLENLDHSGKGQVIVHGVGDLMTQMARCCKPVPYDPIVGYITKGRGVTVHRQDCNVVKNMNEANQARLIDVTWSESPDESSSYLVDIQIIATDRKGLLRDVSSVFSNNDISVVGVHSHTNRKKDKATLRFTAEVADLRQISQVMDRLTQIPDIIDVRRQV